MRDTSFFVRLLDWCSERVEGSMRSFAETHAWIAGVGTTGEANDWALSAYKLQVLGHLELMWHGEGRWAVTPPVITVLDESGGNALLVGARPRWLMERLQNLPDDTNSLLRDLSQRVMLDEPRVQPNRDGPPALYLSARSDADIGALCAELGIQFEHRLAARLREVLPVIDSYIDMGWNAPTLPGFAPRKFDLSTPGRWREVDDDSAPGSYEFTRYGPPRYFFRDDSGKAEVEKWIAVYAELRRIGRNVIFYRHQNRTLLVPARQLCRCSTLVVPSYVLAFCLATCRSPRPLWIRGSDLPSSIKTSHQSWPRLSQTRSVKSFN